nr:hypothetical protein [uncultured Bacteroides sp.]
MEILRKLVWVLMIATVTVFSSCSDSGDDEVETTIEPKLLSFGFYAEDNQGILSKDYVVSAVPTDNKLTIPLPAFLDRTHLVARFTMNDKNIVLLDGVTQVSGASPNDFSVPLDYIVSNGKSNVKYSVTVTKATNMVWTRMADFADKTVYSGARLVISPTEEIPYLAFKIKDAEAPKSKMSLAKLVNGVWAIVGSTDGFSEGEVASSNYSVDFDSKGYPYVAYSDQTAAVKGAASMMKWDGTSWNYVGEKGFVQAQSTKIELAVVEENKPIVAQINTSRAVSFARNELVMSQYSGTWNNAGLPLLASATPIYLCKMAKSGSDAYLSVIYRGTVDGVNYGYSVYKYLNGSWTSLLSNYLEAGATQTSIVTLNMAATDEAVYVLTSDDALIAGSYRPRLRKYNAADKTWSTVGGEPINMIINSHTSTGLAIAPDGTPFVVYRNEQDYPTVVYLDSDTQQWSSPKVIADVVCDDLNMQFTSTGIGYVSFLDANNHVLTFKYDVAVE